MHGAQGLQLQGAGAPLEVSVIGSRLLNTQLVGEEEEETYGKEGRAYA